MRINSIYVSGYRNLVRQKVEPGAKLNIFTGDNAQGKTNLLESVYLCAIGKSPRTDKDKDLIKWGENIAVVKVNYSCRYGEGEIAITLSANGKKQIAVNSVPIAKVGDLMGYINCVFFSPNEIKIISQSPADRRRFLDIDLCQTDKNYFYSLSRFNKALAQRNAVLKNACSLAEAKDLTSGWNEQIAEEGAKVIAKRRAFCDKLKVYAKKCHEKITDNTETLDLEYVTQISGESVEQIAQNYLQLLSDSTEKDFGLRYTSVGCQRDDISLKVNNVDVRSFGSQGQLRTTALALKLAELCIFKNIVGEYPVLLLDDVLSELDAERQSRLLHFDSNLQILLTSATEVPAELSGDCTTFTIEKGTCKKTIEN